MNRLSDEVPGDPLAEEAIALLTAAATPPRADVKRRVWIALLEPTVPRLPHRRN